MTRSDDPRWLYDSSEGDASIRDEARAFVADLLVGVLFLFALFGAISVGRLFFGGTP